MLILDEVFGDIMANKILWFMLAAMFIFGWFCSSAYSNVLSHIIIVDSAESEANVELADSSVFDRYFFKSKELISPSDWISQDQIHVYPDKVVIELDNPQWAVFTDTNSMDPVIDSGAHAIEVVPESPEDISVGDIVSYDSEFAEGTVIHRVFEIGEDSQGWYCRTKGDNNAFEDPGKIRFSQIQRVLVAVIY